MINEQKNLKAGDRLGEGGRERERKKGGRGKGERVARQKGKDRKRGMERVITGELGL